MKAKDVLHTLHITRQTLCRYVKTGTIKVTKLPNGTYDYDEASVYGFLNKDAVRKTYLYARVSTQKQKLDIEDQINMLKQFCFMNGYQVSGIFSDIASGVHFENRKDFFKLLGEVMEGRVERIVVTHKDRLSRTSFDLLQYLFLHYHCQIVAMSEVESKELDMQEMPGEVTDLLHCYDINCSKKSVQKMSEVLLNGGGI